MDQPRLSQLIASFFSCDRRLLLAIFDELLSAFEAESALPPGMLMSRNYDTAQANPEIHTIPGNLKDARDAIFPFFWGTDSWQSKLHLENVKGPPNFASLIGAFAALLKNPNLCVDTYCLRSNELEVKSITALANLIFYHTDSPWGVFTMGGTISNLYGGKLGIEKVAPGTMQRGLQGQRIAGIVSEAGHYSNATLAGWLGMGIHNLHAVPTDRDLSMRLDLLEQKLEALYREQTRVAFVIATFGTTDAFGIDDIRAVRDILERQAARHAAVVPHLHVDAAVGWVSCFLTEYDLETNPLKERLAQLPFCKVLNAETPGPSVVWWVLPRGRDARQIFAALEAGTLSAQERERYFYEVRHLFDKREAMLDPARDARLSFTRSMGYTPHGWHLPAWKAVFFNPKSDQVVIERIVASVEDVA